MTDYIIVDFQPFVIQQKVAVYTEGKCVKEVQVEVDRIINVVNGLRKTYNVKQVMLCGNEDYLANFQAKMNLEFADNANCDIKIVRK